MFDYNLEKITKCYASNHESTYSKSFGTIIPQTDKCEFLLEDKDIQIGFFLK